MAITKIFFDLDGTLFDKKREYVKGRGTIDDSHEYLRYVTYTLGKKQGLDHSSIGKVVQQYESALKNNSLIQALETFSPDLKKEYHDLVKFHKANALVFDNVFGAGRNFFPEVISHVDFDLLLCPDLNLKYVLDKLSKSYGLGMMSNELSITIEKVLGALGLESSYFDPILCGENLPAKKPSPLCFQAIGNPLQEKAYVGDVLDKDILPAKELGIYGVHVVHNGRPLERKDGYVQIGSLDQLLEVFPC